MLSVSHADVYTDFNGLAALKNEARDKSPEAIREVAKQFESVFLNRVLKSMREAKLADTLLDSKQSDFYRDMYDQQLAIHLSGDPGVGLAELIARQLSPEKPEEQSEPLDVEDYLNRSVGLRAAPPKAGTEKQAVAPVKDEVETVKIAEDRPLNSQERFVSQLRPFAEQAAAELGVDANVLLAQAALETGWGKSVLRRADGGNSHNLFNIKADGSWRGRQVRLKTLEFDQGVGRQEMSAFRVYDSYRDSFADYVAFIKGNPRYAKALSVRGSAERYVSELQRAGYATDPAYADKVMRIYRGDAINGASVVAMK